MNNLGGIQWRGVHGRGVQRRQFRNRLEELVNRISERVLQEVMRHLEDTLEDRLIQLISERLPDILIERLPSVVEDMMDDVANGVMERLETLLIISLKKDYLLMIDRPSPIFGASQRWGSPGESNTFLNITYL